VTAQFVEVPRSPILACKLTIFLWMMAARTLSLAALLVVRVECFDVDIALECQTWEDRDVWNSENCHTLFADDAQCVAVQATECKAVPKSGIHCQCRCFTEINQWCGKEPDTTVEWRVFPQRFRGRTGGKCLDSGKRQHHHDHHGDLEKGDELFMWDCAGSIPQDVEWTNQMWTPFDGQIRATSGPGQKCMDVSHGNISRGALLQVKNCSGLPQQQFNFDYVDGLLHVSSTFLAHGGGAHLCVDSPGGGFNNGDAMRLWDCDSSQAWDLVDALQSPAPTAVI